MTPIRLCILWHQHQPYYRAGNRFAMPWAWLHATKDYLEMAEHLERHPKMRATINLVPSLLKQLEEYVSKKVSDPVVDLMSKPSADLTSSDRRCMIENFFLANRETVINRSPRFRELLEKAGEGRAEEKAARLTTQDFIDLAVHYSLAWTGEIARMREPFQSLVAKERNYTEDDKQRLAEAQLKNVKRIVPLHRKLAERGQVELTTTPFYHPILPLLIDSEVAREAMPNVPLPKRSFRGREEAMWQLRNGREYFESKMGVSPRGLWPSEGSVSKEAVELIRENGFEWIATDEAILASTLGVGSAAIGRQSIQPVHAKYFPWRMKLRRGSVTMFFRDHRLSDDIGFTYQSWGAKDAAEHFIQRIKQIRSDLTNVYGDEILERACVPVILDGENCWEYYPRNGFEFLDALYERLESTPEIRTATFSEVLDETEALKLPVLKNFVAGSWINANFKIWIGHPEDNAAWDVLAKAKDVLERERSTAQRLTGEARQRAMAAVEAAHEELMIAEGSDWFWWYGDEHYSAQKDIFDELFRMHARAVYVKLGKTVPDELLRPIAGRAAPDSSHPRFGAMHRFEEQEQTSRPAA